MARKRNVIDNVRVNNAFLFEIMIIFEGDKIPFKGSYDKQNLTLVVIYIQPNFNGSNTFETMKICSRQGSFELMSISHSAGGIMGISFRFSLT